MFCTGPLAPWTRTQSGKSPRVASRGTGSALAGLLCSIAFGLPAVAADATADSQNVLEEVIVTANRAESSAQRTAVALTVYTGADLEARGVASIQSLSAVDPSVNLTSTTGTAYVAVRGIASTDVTEIGDPSVPIARDGFYTNRYYAIQTSMYDLARVEVLKGPQGTLNGRNSTGGLISIITNRPAYETGGYLNIEAGTFSALNVDGAANIALSDNAAFRVSALKRKHAGYRHLTSPIPGVRLDEYGDDENLDSVRAQFAYKPAENVSLWASYQRDNVDDVGDVALSTAALGERPSFGDARSFAGYAPTYNRLTDDRVRWEATVSKLPAGLMLVYAGGWDSVNYHHAIDATGPYYPALRQYIADQQPVTWNHELRLSNSADSRLFYQIGYFHFEENNQMANALYNLDMLGPFAAGGPLSFATQDNRNALYFPFHIKTRSDAVFGQLAYAVNEQLKLSVGFRETWDKKQRSGTSVMDFDATVFPLVPCSDTAPGPTTPPCHIYTNQTGNMKASEPTYHIGLDYTPNAHTLVYVKYDRGYKSGGFNSDGVGQSVPYDAEKLDAFEVGSKNMLAGNRIQLNAAAFYFNYKGYQGSQFSAAVGGGSGVFNVGSAKIYGGEIQFVGLFAEGGRFDLNSSLLHSKFGNGITINDGNNVPRDISGHRLPNAPSAVISAGLEYAFSVGSGNLTPRIDGKYSSSFDYSVFNLPDEKSESYVVGNASLSYAPAQGGWEVQAFVRNFTDRIVLSYAVENYLAQYNSYSFQPPRTFGARVNLKF